LDANRNVDCDSDDVVNTDLDPDVDVDSDPDCDLDPDGYLDGDGNSHAKASDFDADSIAPISSLAEPLQSTECRAGNA
jgi:hypothetical protein